MALTESHEDALRALYPLDLCEQIIGDLKVPVGAPCTCVFCQIRRIDAAYFDGIGARLADIRISTFSLEEVGDLSAWEAFLGLPANPALTDAQRWSRIRDARTSRNGYSLGFFQSLATQLGYAVTITRGVYPFRAGISKADDLVKSVNRLSSPTPSDVNDIRNQAQVVTNPYDPSQGQTLISATAPYPSDFWTWTVHVTDLGMNSDSILLRERFEALKPNYSLIIWQEP